jgi:hypothetical protein
MPGSFEVIMPGSIAVCASGMAVGEITCGPSCTFMK